MSHGPLEHPLPSSEPDTETHPRKPSASVVQPSESPARDAEHPAGDFAEVEGPTLSSPSISSDPRFGTVAALQNEMEDLEARLASTEQALQEVYGAVEHLVKSQETTERALRQQRMSRYLVWGTLILILGVFWMTLQARMNQVLPH